MSASQSRSAVVLQLAEAFLECFRQGQRPSLNEYIDRHPELARGLVGPVTLVLDNARYQRNALVMGLAQELGIELLFLPSYSPNLNLIERLWRFVKRRAAYGKYHPTFADFRAAVQDVLDCVPTTHAEKLASLMTLNFQEFEDVSFLAA